MVKHEETKIDVTDHAVERLTGHRFGCSRDKCKKIATKAFFSKEVEPKKLNQKIKVNLEKGKILKRFMGREFVFRVTNDGTHASLITVLGGPNEKEFKSPV
jgi:hypothetical protein